MRAVFLPKLRGSPVGEVSVVWIVFETDAFELRKVAEEIDVLCLRRKGELLECLAVRERRKVGERGAGMKI